MKQMKLYSIIILLQLCISCLSAQDTLPAINLQDQSVVATVADKSPKELLQEANDLYVKGEYPGAINIYEELLKNYGVSSDVYYNLGNAYYKVNDIAPAILNYERALLLNPGDGDIRFNLEMARLKTVDKMEPVEAFFLLQWISNLRNIYSTNQWAWVGIVSFLLLIVCLVLFFFGRKILLKKMGFYIGIFCLVLAVSGNVFAYQQKKRLTDRDVAIVFVPTVTIKGSPDQSGTDIVVLHEGTKVFIKRTLSNWSEVVLEDGNVGWIESRMIEII